MKTCLLMLALIFLITGAGYAFEVYVADNDQGDAALIISDDAVMIIDIVSTDGLSALFELLASNDVDVIDSLVLTHPSHDAIASLERLAAIHPIKRLIIPAYISETNNGELLRGLVDGGTQIIHPYAGGQTEIGHATVTILSVVDPSLAPNGERAWSLVLRVDCGERSIVIAGDAADFDQGAGLLRSADVLKISRCPGAESFPEELIAAVRPDYLILPYQYEYPYDKTIAILDKYQVELLPMDAPGTWHRLPDGSSPAIQPSSAAEVDYILNTNTMKFHYPSCSSVGQMKEQNKTEYEGSRDALIDQGYSPCGNCNP